MASIKGPQKADLLDNPADTPVNKGDAFHRPQVTHHSGDVVRHVPLAPHRRISTAIKALRAPPDAVIGVREMLAGKVAAVHDPLKDILHGIVVAALVLSAHAKGVVGSCVAEVADSAA